MGNLFWENGKNTKKILLILSLILVVIALTIIISNAIVKWATASDNVIDFLGGNNSSNDIVATAENTEEEQEEEGEVEKISAVIIGLDESERLADVIMVMQFNPEDNSFKCVSIPRDLYIDFYDSKFFSIKNENNVNVRYCKLTEVYQNSKEEKEGLKAIKEIAEEIVGIQIDYYVKVDLDGFKAIVDLIGGIEVDIPRNMIYHDWSQDFHVHLEAGLQTLDSEKAEQLVRYRHGYVDGDLGRIRMQQAVLKSLCTKILEIRNPIEIFSLVKEGYKYIETDFSLLGGMKYIEYVVDLDIDNIFQEEYMVTIPTYGEKIDGLWYEMQDEYKTKEILDELFNKEDYD